MFPSLVWCIFHIRRLFISIYFKTNDRLDGLFAVSVGGITEGKVTR
jgi:hypothetical protein